MNASANGQRILIWASIVFALLYAFGYCVLTDFFPPPSPALDAAQVAQLYTSHNMQLRIGVVICIISAGFSLPWSVALGIQMARHEKGIPLWAIVQTLAGLMATVLFMLPALFWGVAAYSASRDPAITLIMHELSFLTLVTPVTWFLLQAVPIGVIGLFKKDEENTAFPRWMGFMSIWMAVGAELGVFAQLFRTGQFAWNGLFTFWIPLTFFSIWFAALNYTMLRAITRQERAAMASSNAKTRA